MVAWAPCWALELASYKEEALALSFVLSKTFLPVRVSLRFRRLTVLTTKLNQGAAGADHKGLVLDPLVWGARRRRVVISSFLYVQGAPTTRVGL